MAATTVFSTVYTKLQDGLGDSTDPTLKRIKLAINQAYRRIGSVVFGIDITTDLVNAGDVINMEDAWIYVLVAGSFSEYYSLWDDSRAPEKDKTFQELIAYMVKSYGTRQGAQGTFQQLWTDLVADLGMWSKEGVGKVKGAINDALSELLSYEDFSFNKGKDAVAFGNGGYSYTLRPGIRKVTNVRVGASQNVAALEKKDPEWVNYSIEQNSADSRPTHWCEDGTAFDMSGTFLCQVIKINKVIPTGVLIWYDFDSSFQPLINDGDAINSGLMDYTHTIKTMAVAYVTGTIKDMQAAEKAKKAMRMEQFKNDDNDVTMQLGKNNVK